jgi:hypothetical protein
LESIQKINQTCVERGDKAIVKTFRANFSDMGPQAMKEKLPGRIYLPWIDPRLDQGSEVFDPGATCSSIMKGRIPNLIESCNIVLRVKH